MKKNTGLKINNLKKSNKKRKTGILYNIILTLGIVIGIGIFFKNSSIISYAKGDTGVIVAAWLVGGLITMCSAVAFTLMNLKTKNSDNNLGEFVRHTYGERAGKTSSYFFNLIGYPILVYVINIFTCLMLFNLIGVHFNNALDQSLAINGASVLFTFLLVLYSYVVPKLSKYLQVSTTFIKLLPFIIMTVVAIYAIFSKNEFAYWNTGNKGQIGFNQHLANQTNNMSKGAIVFWCIPAILFAFEGYLCVSGNKRATSAKSTSIGIGIGIAIITIIYILTTVAILKEGVLNVDDTLVSFFGGDPNHLSRTSLIIKKVVLAIIVISGLGAANGTTIIWTRMSKQLAEDSGKKNKSYLLSLIGFTFGVCPWIIASIATKTGAEMFDLTSDVLLFIGFCIYGSILIKGVVKHGKEWDKYRRGKIANKDKTQTEKPPINPAFFVFAIIAIIGILLTVGYKVADGIVIQSILHAKDPGALGKPKWTYLLLFFSVVLQYIIAPFISKSFLENKKPKLVRTNKPSHLNK